MIIIYTKHKIYIIIKISILAALFLMLSINTLYPQEVGINSTGNNPINIKLKL